ncbi:MAG: TonB family protein [Acidobacteriota bacterium]|nr:TonB family protein [Acidobacteriota bacterium]MDQ7086896.1 TonB family protein [Acidobacteriota bacterium]
MTLEPKIHPLLWMLQKALVVVGALACTLGLFVLLPLMQAIGSPAPADLVLEPVDVADFNPPPPPPPVEEKVEEEPEEEPPPQLEEQAAPLDLAQLELALNPNPVGGAFGDFVVDIAAQLTAGRREEAIDEVFSLDDLDQKPSLIFQRMPRYPQELRKKGKTGTVFVVFLVDQNGKVKNPKVEKSSDPLFEKPALEAVKQWKFEPGTRNGRAVPFKLRIPIRFNAG